MPVGNAVTHEEHAESVGPLHFQGAGITGEYGQKPNEESSPVVRFIRSHVAIQLERDRVPIGAGDEFGQLYPHVLHLNAEFLKGSMYS